MQALYWFNPMVWLAFRQMRRDREAYCDWTVLTELSDENARDSIRANYFALCGWMQNTLLHSKRSMSKQSASEISFESNCWHQRDKVEKNCWPVPADQLGRSLLLSDSGSRAMR